MDEIKVETVVIGMREGIVTVLEFDGDKYFLDDEKRKQIDAHSNTNGDANASSNASSNARSHLTEEQKHQLFIECISEKGEDTEQLADEIIEEKINPKILRGRSPNNTILFLNWIETNKITEFVVKDFTDAFACIDNESAEKIISHQIHLKNLTQMGNLKFKVN